MADEQRSPGDAIPADPLTPLAETAARAHEVYLAYRAAGFTDRQALYLVGCQIKAGVRRGR